MLGKVFHKKFKLTDYTTNERMVIMVLIGTVPLVIATFLGDTVEFLSSYTLAIGIILIFNSVMLFVSDKLAAADRRHALYFGQNAPRRDE